MPALETIGNFLLLFTAISCMLLIVFLVLKLFGKQKTLDNKAEFSIVVALSSAVALWALFHVNEHPASPWIFQGISLSLVAFSLPGMSGSWPREKMPVFIKLLFSMHQPF